MNRYSPLLAAVAVSLLTAATPISAAETKIDPTGAWLLHVNRPGRPPSETTLKLEKAGDKLVGVLTDNQGRATPIKDAQLKDGELSFRVTFEREGQQINIQYKGKLTADAIKGQITFSVLGQKRGFDFDGKRAKNEPTLAGSWRITIPLEGGEKLQPTVRLKQEGEKVTGDYVGASGKEVPLAEVRFKDGTVSFQAPDRVEGDKITLHYQGKLTGDKITGTVKIDAGPQADSLKFQAERVKVSTASVAGTWQLKVTLKDGPTFEPTIKLTQTGSALSGTYQGEQGETAIRDALIFGDELTFEVTRDRAGKKYKLRYQGTVKGDAVKGLVEYTFDGMGGLLDFEGKRQKP